MRISSKSTRNTAGHDFRSARRVSSFSICVSGFRKSLNSYYTGPVTPRGYRAIISFPRYPHRRQREVLDLCDPGTPSAITSGKSGRGARERGTLSTINYSARARSAVSQRRSLICRYKLIMKRPAPNPSPLPPPPLRPPPRCVVGSFVKHSPRGSLISRNVSLPYGRRVSDSVSHTPVPSSHFVSPL